jgi:hypothetical protein
MRALDLAGWVLASSLVMICSIFSGENYMKHLRHFCLAVALTFALAAAALAGDINCGIVSLPSDPPPASIVEEMPDGDTAKNGESTGDSFADPLTEFTLSILQGLLSLF